MSLKKFSANLKYESQDGCEYSSEYFQNPKNPEANKVLLDLLEHISWMGAVGGQAEATKAAFERGYKQGLERKDYLDSLKESNS
ncbi:hypothetical protein [Acinetobacter sp. YH12045]|uniref:hypothetical protein n=1 Tax=Acinetobacter sp. YH12045 TaxID=2601051 RepID=UPI0015D36378|nr:hypothetical protein [Acinetobacter sp. YH12045]